MIRKSLCALVGATLVCALPATPAAAAESCVVAEAAPKPKKKKGFGFGSILKAANQAGVGNMLSGGMLGSGKMGQVAGAVTGTAANLARSSGGASQRSSGAAEASCGSSAGPIVNAYK